MNASCKQDRDELASSAANKMAEALATAWQRGECVLVKRTIEKANSPRMSEDWQRQTAERLLPTERDYFNKYMRG